MYSEIKISDKAGVAVIDIEGVIGLPEKMQFEKPGDKVATYAGFTESLKSISSLASAQVVVNIRSTGGDVNDALLIYEALRSLDARVTTRCYGYVASAATIIAQAASRGCREIASTTLYLIHCSESVAEGNYGSMSRTMDMLEKTDARIASIYTARSGMAEEGFVNLMNENNGKGRWLSAHEAVDAGLADKVIEPHKTVNAAHDHIVMAALGAMAVMGGITMTPELEHECSACVAGEASEKSFFRKIRERMTGFLTAFSRASPDHYDEAVKEIPSQVNEPAPGNTGIINIDKSSAMRLKDGQVRAMPTRTLPREDPSVGDIRRNPNDAAYFEDAMSMRTGMER